MVLHFHFTFKPFPGHAQKREREREKEKERRARRDRPKLRSPRSSAEIVRLRAIVINDLCNRDRDRAKHRANRDLAFPPIVIARSVWI